MKRRLALIVALVMVALSAFALLTACSNLTECEKNGHQYNQTTGICSVCGLKDPAFKTECEKNGHKYDDKTGICSVCNQKDPDFKTECERNGHKYVDGVCSVCNNNISSNDNANDKVITFISSQGDTLQKLTKLAIDEFEAKYPGWTVDHQTAGGWSDVQPKITGLLQANDQPDLAYCYPDHVANYLASGKVVDLNKYNATKDTLQFGNGEPIRIGWTEKELADFEEIFWNEGLAKNFAGYAAYGYSDSAMFTIPLMKSTEVLYYNKTALDAAGITKLPETWDELWEICAQLLAKYPKCTPLGYDSEANWLITMCAQNGWGYTTAAGGDQDHYLFNNAGVKEWLQDIQGKHMIDKYFTTQEIYGGYTSTLFTTGVADNAAGCVFCIGSSGGASYQSTNKFEVGAAHIPGSYNERTGKVNSTAISQGPSLVMFHSDKASNADEKEYMTYLFVKELLDVEEQVALCMDSGYNPVRKSAYDNEVYKKWLDEGKTLIAKVAAVGRTMSQNKEFFTSPAFVGSSTARNVVGDMIVSILKGSDITKEVEDAIKACGGKLD